MTRHSRAQANYAVALILFFGTLVVGAFLHGLLNIPAEAMFDMAANATNNSTASRGIDHARTAWSYWAWFVSFLSMILLIAAAAYSGGRYS